MPVVPKFKVLSLNLFFEEITLQMFFYTPCKTGSSKFLLGTLQVSCLEQQVILGTGLVTWFVLRILTVLRCCFSTGYYYARLKCLLLFFLFLQR